MNNTIQYTVDKDGIAILMLDLPGKSMNVLCDELIADLSACVEKVASDETVKGAIVASAKPAFVAGADLTEPVPTRYPVVHRDAPCAAAARCSRPAP